jgi:hypothetical protein
MTTTRFRRRTPHNGNVDRPDGPVLLGLTALASALLLTACGAAASSATTTAPVGSASASVQPTSAAPPQSVPLGTAVTLPTDTFDVSHLLDHAAPTSPKPEPAGTHWASFAVKHCATAASVQGRWEIDLADGTVASEPTGWPDGLPDAIFPNEDPYAAGDCESGRVYIAMPDGGVASAVVLKPKAAGPVRPEVRWLVGRTSASS